MKKMQSFFDRLSPTLNKIGSNRYLLTIMESMMATLGPIILGSLAVLLLVFPVKAVPKALTAWGFTPILTAVNTFTVGALALYIVFLMARNLVGSFMPEDNGSAAGIIALMSFLFVTPMGNIVTKKVTTSALPSTWLGSQGVFSAMIIGLVVGRLYVYIRQHNWTIKMPNGVPPMVSNAFAALIPTVVIGFLFILIARLFAFTPYGNMHQFIYSVIQIPLRGIGGSIWAMILVSLLMQLLWFFGIHGTNVILPLVTPIWLSMDMENLNAVSNGQTPQNIIGLAFFNVVTWSGLALGLVLLMMFAKSKQYKELGRLSIVPALFGITEPVIFGTPLVLNFDLAIPFIFNNTIALIIAYVVTKIGLVGTFIGAQTVFGLPLGFFAGVEGKISIIVMQLVIQLIVSPLLWYPWFKRADMKAYRAEKSNEG
ncbi:PTS sugar transporter subunit IIC [Lactiplantibacillus fabifermentans]|uniref:Permease IIC component n=1 Tax=Lactiplantibacillus fabifermentans DSM 21115 TaxID=1413187 RepID=A0A0R2NSX7_9LACO|nr:PTS transporter subunit EIIC [Lactiplantibacillus fabifermentans]KRO28757.1 pts family oligomeric beta-glucoside porter component iic [Lactiplantibacillus fabifermentans DSM 21115]